MVLWKLITISSSVIDYSECVTLLCTRRDNGYEEDILNILSIINFQYSINLYQYKSIILFPGKIQNSALTMLLAGDIVLRLGGLTCWMYDLRLAPRKEPEPTLEVWVPSARRACSACWSGGRLPTATIVWNRQRLYSGAISRLSNRPTFSPDLYSAGSLLLTDFLRNGSYRDDNDSIHTRYYLSSFLSRKTILTKTCMHYTLPIYIIVQLSCANSKNVLAILML